MSSSADAIANAENSFALIVGIGQYQDERISKLEYTHADARAFYELLIDPQRAGFKSENVNLLLDANATHHKIRKAINTWLYGRLTPNATALIFFAGHGAQEQDKRSQEAGKQSYYFLPWDADCEDLASTAISHTEFDELLQTLHVKRMVIFLDACHSTGVAKPGGRDVGIAGSPRFDRLAEGEGRVIVAAAKPEQRSWEDPKLQHGIFTHHLIEALRGKADYDGDGYVSIQEVVAYLQKEVPRSARLLGKEPQDPTLICESMSKDIILAVDAERLKARETERSESARRRVEEMRAKRFKLVDLRSRGELPLTEFTEALLIIEKEPDALTPIEAMLKQWLDLLFMDRIDSKLYVQTRAKIHRETTHRSKPTVLAPPPEHDYRHWEATGESSKSPIPPIPPERQKPGLANAPATAFCIHCGTRNGPDNLFCISCGRRIR
ncbi:MAG: caspase family protein [Verrucomicrobiota bacterium]